MKKKVILIIIFILIIVVIGAILAFLYFTTDLFKPTSDLFWKYLAQNEDITTILANDKYELQTQFKQTNSYTSSGILSVTIQQGEDSFKEMNVATTSRHDFTTGRTYANATLKNGDIDLFQVSYINSDDVYAIKCDEVFANYVGIKNSELKELAESYGLSNANVPDSIDLGNYMNLLDITYEQKQHIVDTYLPIITSNISSDRYSKTIEQVALNGVTYDSNVYALQLTGEEVRQILINCLSNLKSDSETLVLISNKLSGIGFGVDYTDVSNLTSRIDEIIAKAQQMTIEDNINIYVYENNGETIRTVIEIGNKTNITYDRAGNNSTVTIDIEHAGDYDITDMNIIKNMDTNDTNEDTNEITINTYENQDEIIDLSAQNNTSTESTTTSRIIISKEVTDNLTTNTIQIIPDINDATININIECNLSNIQSESIANNYIISLINESESTEITTITYNNNIYRADQVEEITELTNSNTAIANNYPPEAFNTFINNWRTIFLQKMKEKMAVLGFEV